MSATKLSSCPDRAFHDADLCAGFGRPSFVVARRAAAGLAIRACPCEPRRWSDDDDSVDAKRAIDVPTHSDARRTTLPSRAAADVSSKDSAVRRSLPSTGHAVGRRDAAAQLESHVEISGSSCWMASKYAELRR